MRFLLSSLLALILGSSALATTPDERGETFTRLVSVNRWALRTLGRGLAPDEAAHLRDLPFSEWHRFVRGLESARWTRSDSFLQSRRGRFGIRASRDVATATVWFKTPEAIEATLVMAFGLRLTAEERWLYLHGMHALLGGTVVSDRAPMIERPNQLYSLAVGNLSLWLAGKLVEAQAAAETAGTDYLFEGLGLVPDDTDGCYADLSGEWCELRDGLTLRSLSSVGLDPAAITPELRKRLRHNVQDIGEFLYLNVGPTLVLRGAAGVDAPSYLIDQVFLPALGPAPVTAERERTAWALVVEAILLSGAFYFELP